MSHVPELPEELLTHVFANLQVGGPVEDPVEDRLRRKTLAAVCRANKQCCRLAQPILYHSVRLCGHDGTIRHLWESVVQRPELASFVQAMYIDDWEFPKIQPGFSDEEFESEAGRLSTKVSEELKESTLQAMKPLRTVVGSLHQSLEQSLLAGLDDGMLALLIVVCQNIRYLELVVPFEFEDYSTVSLLLNLQSQMQSRRVKHLSRLEEMSLQHWDTEGAFNAQLATDLWGFPSLKIFRGHMMDLTGEPAFLAEMSGNNLREVHLTYSLIDADGFRALLKNCSKLEVLSIEWGSAVVGDCEIHYQEFGQAFRDLPHVSKNLKRLVLDHGDAFYVEYTDWEFFAPLGSLKVLESLEYLAVTSIALIGEDDEDENVPANFEQLPLADVLPDNLRRLDIRNGRETMHDADNTLYELMAAPGHSKLNTIGMFRRITQRERLPDVGWTMTEFSKHDVVLERDVQDPSC